MYKSKCYKPSFNNAPLFGQTYPVIFDPKRRIAQGDNYLARSHICLMVLPIH
jgi:hypothetical protein